MRALVVAVSCSFLFPATGLAAPPEPQGGTDPQRCTWEWMSGGGIGVWAERCDLDTGLWALRFDATLPDFVLTVDGVDAVTVLQAFAKPADAPIEAILPELRSRGYVPDDGDCVFEPADIRPVVRTMAYFDIRPTGARKDAFDATPPDEVPEPPCGDYGWSTHGVQYFVSDLRFPDRIVYVNTGQDGLMFDPATLTPE